MDSDDFYDFSEKVESKDDFIKFLEGLLQNLHDYPDDWDNNDLKSYIDGFYGFVLSIDGYYKNTNQNIDTEKITWNMLAKMMRAARVYE
jgi:hypothetical protein